MRPTALVVTFYMLTPICNGTEATCGWPGGGSVDIGTQIMVQQINKRGFLRGNASLRVIVIDDHCNADIGIEEASKILMLQKADWPFGVLGSGCSGATHPLTRIFGTARVPLISYATAPMLSNRALYPYFYRLTPPDQTQIDVWFSICFQLSWRRFAAVYDSVTRTTFSAYLKRLLDSYGGDMIDLIAGSPVIASAEDADLLLREVMEARVRAVMMITYATAVRQFACEMVQHRVQDLYLFHLGWFADGWQYEHLDSHECSRGDMNSISEYWIFASYPAYHYDLDAVSPCAMPNYRIRDFAQEYEIQRRALNEEFRGEASHSADMVCMMALLFNEMLEEVGVYDQIINMNESTWRLFNSKAQAIRFSGMSGTVSFPPDGAADGAGDRISSFGLFQKIAGNAEEVGMYVDGSIRWKSGKSIQFRGNYTLRNPPPALFPSCPEDEQIMFDGSGCQKCTADRMIDPRTARCECRQGYSVNDTRCIACARGSFGEWRGVTSCASCLAGFFTEEVGQTACLHCPVGRFAESQGSSRCWSCPSGQTTKFQGATQASDCKCEVGSYMDSSGTNCKSCSMLLTTPEIGAVSSEDCTMSEWVKQTLGGGISGFFSITLLLGFVLWKWRRAQQRRVALLEAKQSLRYSEFIQKASHSMRSLDFPMVLIRADHFLRLGQLTKHEILRDDGKLVFLDDLSKIMEFKRKYLILFISHQWLGWGEPDPENYHYMAMSAAIKNVVDNAESYADVAVFTAGSKAPTKQWYVWCDFASIPQDAAKMQLLAITSLPVYACLAHTFVIVAPMCHHNDTGTPCDLRTYMARGWCRAEILSKLCGTGLRQMYYVDDTSGHIKTVTAEFVDLLDFRVFQGDFSCCRLHHKGANLCDKEKLVAAILGLYALVLRHKDEPRIALVLERIESGKRDYFPPKIDFVSDHGKTEERELFGNMIEMLEDQMRGPRTSHNAPKTSLFLQAVIAEPLQSMPIGAISTQPKASDSLEDVDACSGDELFTSVMLCQKVPSSQVIAV